MFDHDAVAWFFDDKQDTISSVSAICWCNERETCVRKSTKSIGSGSLSLRSRLNIHRRPPGVVQLWFWISTSLWIWKNCHTKLSRLNSTTEKRISKATEIVHFVWSINNVFFECGESKFDEFFSWLYNPLFRVCDDDEKTAVPMCKLKCLIESNSTLKSVKKSDRERNSQSLFFLRSRNSSDFWRWQRDELK